jgi:hypothetical protein
MTIVAAEVDVFEFGSHEGNGPYAGRHLPYEVVAEIAAVAVVIGVIVASDIRHTGARADVSPERIVRQRWSRGAQSACGNHRQQDP